MFFWGMIDREEASNASEGFLFFFFVSVLTLTSFETSQ